MLARLLTPEDFGVIAMVVPFVILMNAMGNLGFQTTLIQADRLSPATTGAFYRFALLANLGLAAMLGALGVLLAWFYNEPRVILLSVVWALLCWLLTFTSFQEAMLKREMRFPTVVTIQLVALLAGIASAIVAAKLGAGFWALFVQAVVVELVRSTWVHLLTRWRPDDGTSGDQDEVRALKQFWRSLAGFRAAALASEQPDRLLVGRIGGAPVMGVYDTARRWSSYAIVEPFISLSDIAVASLSRVRSDPATFRLYFARQARAILTIAMPVIAFAGIEPGSVVRTLLGPQWDAAVPFLRILCIAAFCGSLTRLTEWVYFSTGTSVRLLRWSLLVQTPALIVAALVGSIWGAIGVTIGYTLATAALAIPSVMWCVRGTDLWVSTFLRASARPAIAALGATIPVLALALFLEMEVGLTRLLMMLTVYCTSFMLVWLATPGGGTAAREFAMAVRELRRVATEPQAGAGPAPIESEVT